MHPDGHTCCAALRSAVQGPELQKPTSYSFSVGGLVAVGQCVSVGRGVREGRIVLVGGSVRVSVGVRVGAGVSVGREGRVGLGVRVLVGERFGAGVRVADGLAFGVWDADTPAGLPVTVKCPVVLKSNPLNIY